jgi:hypothetical protein
MVRSSFQGSAFEPIPQRRIHPRTPFTGNRVTYPSSAKEPFVLEDGSSSVPGDRCCLLLLLLLLLPPYAAVRWNKSRLIHVGTGTVGAVRRYHYHRCHYVD